MESPVQKIKEHLTIEEVISSYIKLEKTGANYKARCPFHNEKTPSFFVSPQRQSYYCFGCGAKGDIFTFVEQFEGLDFKGALNLLAKRAGISLSEWRGASQADTGEKDRLYKVVEEATKYFKKELEKNNDAKEYLKERGVTDKTIEDFRIGFARNSWNGLYDHLKNSFSKEEMEKAGLIKKSEKNVGDGYYDRFRSRIMFPISDSSGRVVAFSGRIFPHNDNEGKYLNSPETPIFKKSSVLYGIDRAKDSIRKNDFSIVVEGQFDLLLSHQAGFKNTVATLGTALTDSDTGENNTTNNFGIIKRLSENIVFVFDSDKAGFSASMRAASTALAFDMNVKASDTGKGFDPADLIQKKGIEEWKKVIREAKHIIEFLLDKLLSDFSSKDFLKTKVEIESKIIPYLRYIENPVKRSHFISLISHRTGIREEDIRESLKKKIAEEKKEEDRREGGSNLKLKQATENLIRKDYILRRLMGIVLWKNGGGNKDFNTEEVLSKISKITNISTDELISSTKSDIGELVFEAEIFYGENIDIKRDLNEMLSNLEEEYLKSELARKMMELEAKERQKDSEGSKEILKTISDINNKIQNIKNGRIK